MNEIKKTERYIGEKFIKTETIYAFKNYNTIISELEKGTIQNFTDKDKVQNKPIICVGSGLSLNRAMEILPYWKYEIMCSASQVSTLHYYNIDIDYIVDGDPHIEPDQMSVPDIKDIGAKHVMSAGNRSSIIKWLIENKQKVYIYLKNNGLKYWDTIREGYDKISTEHKILHKYTPQITTILNCTHYATQTHVALCEYLGYNPIILVGCDSVIDRADMWRYDQIQKTWILNQSRRSTMGQDTYNFDKYIERMKERLARVLIHKVSILKKYRGKLTTSLLIKAAKAIDKRIKSCQAEVIDTSIGGILRCKKESLNQIIERYK